MTFDRIDMPLGGHRIPMSAGSPSPQWLLDVELPHEPASVPRARAAVLAACDADGDAAYDLALIVSELVTNAVVHADPAPIGLRLGRTASALRVEVRDGGAGFAVDLPAAEGAEIGGWGMRFVDRLAERWGIEPGGPPTIVWAELPPPDAGAIPTR